MRTSLIVNNTTLASQPKSTFIPKDRSHGFNVIKMSIDHESGQEIYIMQKNSRDYLNEEIIKDLKPIENCKNYYLFIFVRYLSKQGRKFVRYLNY